MPTNWDHRPPLEPPPPEVVALYKAYLEAIRASDEAQARLPEPYDLMFGGEERPTELLAQAHRLADARARAAVALYKHPWWHGAFNRAEAQRALDAALKEP